MMKEFVLFTLASVLRLRRLTAELDAAQAAARAVFAMREGMSRQEQREEETMEDFAERLNAEAFTAERRAAQGMASRDKRVKRMAWRLRLAAGMAVVGALTLGRSYYEELRKPKHEWEMPHVPVPEISSAQLAVGLIPAAGKEKNFKLSTEEWTLRRSAEGSAALRAADAVGQEIAAEMKAVMPTLPELPFWMGDAMTALEHMTKLELMSKFGDTRLDETMVKLEALQERIGEIADRNEDAFDPILELGVPLRALLARDIALGGDNPQTQEAAAKMKQALAGVGIEVTVEKN